MQIVLNSKFFNHLSVENLGEATKNLGYDGLDICLRPNHPIDPNNALVELPSATRIWEEQGLKIGFWQFESNDDYWQLFDRARKALDGFTALSRRPRGGAGRSASG